MARGRSIVCSRVKPSFGFFWVLLIVLFLFGTPAKSHGGEFCGFLLVPGAPPHIPNEAWTGEVHPLGHHCLYFYLHQDLLGKGWEIWPSLGTKFHRAATFQPRALGQKGDACALLDSEVKDLNGDKTDEILVLYQCKRGNKSVREFRIYRYKKDWAVFEATKSRILSPTLNPKEWKIDALGLNQKMTLD